MKAAIRGMSRVVLGLVVVVVAIGTLIAVTLRQQPGARDAGTGPITRDVATVRIGEDGVADVEREIEYRGHLGERAAAIPGEVRARAVERLAAFGASDVRADVEQVGSVVRMRLHYTQPGAAGRQLDDYLVQHVQREPVPGRVLFGVDYPLDLEAVRVARIIVPGTVISFDPFTRKQVAPESSVITSIRLENGSSLIVQTRQFVRSGDLVDPATIELASVARMTYSPTYRPSLLRWVVIGVALIVVVFQVRLAIPVTRLERATEPFPNALFALLLSAAHCVAGGLLLLLAFQFAAVPPRLAASIEQAIFTLWPRPSGRPLFLGDLAGALALGGLVLVVCGAGLVLRWRLTRLLILAGSVVSCALVWWQLMIWLPLPSYVRFQLPVLFILGESCLAVLALTIRQVGSFDMRRRFASPLA